jgi:hypothetical protein
MIPPGIVGIPRSSEGMQSAENVLETLSQALNGTKVNFALGGYFGPNYGPYPQNAPGSNGMGSGGHYGGILSLLINDLGLEFGFLFRCYYKSYLQYDAFLYSEGDLNVS